MLKRTIMINSKQWIGAAEPQLRLETLKLKMRYFSRRFDRLKAVSEPKGKAAKIAKFFEMDFFLLT